ncbi:hypothetical protein BaRGS_00014888, partial [Batillaria attramentaria]
CVFRENTFMLLRLTGRSEVEEPRAVDGGDGQGGAGGGGGGHFAHGLMAGLRVLVILTLLVLADSQRWPDSGNCHPCQCYYRLSSFGRLRHVNCSQRRLRAVPEGLPKDLMALDLSWNPLDPGELRQQLCKFKSLQSLSLTFSDLTTLSDIFGECSSVLELNLTGNRLAQLDSATFQGLYNLRRLLGLEAESIMTKEVFKWLTNLRDLDLVFHGDQLPEGLFDSMSMNSVNLVLTQARVLPKGIFSFGTQTLNTIQLVGEQVEELNEDLLKDLYVLRKLFLIMPQVKILPSTFFQSQQRPMDTSKPANLQEVEITGVKSIPANLFNQVDNIESLRLKDITRFPKAGFLAGLINLRRLVITGSRIENIPRGWFKKLNSVKTLQLSNLQLEKLDDDAFVGLLNLNYLDLSYNILPGISGRTLQPLSQTLESLILTGNLLSELSEECLKGLFTLRYLDVSENRLSKVYTNSFRGMTRLSVLYLASNRLTSLPTDLFKDQLQLESLSLADNYLVEFPRAVLELQHSLISLDLSYNEIRGMPSRRLCQFAYLERINIIQNPLHCDCRLLGFQSCQHITVDGACQTPETEYGKSLQVVDVPKSCKIPATDSAKTSRKHQPGAVNKKHSFKSQGRIPEDGHASAKQTNNNTNIENGPNQATKKQTASSDLKGTGQPQFLNTTSLHDGNVSAQQGGSALQLPSTVVRELFQDNSEETLSVVSQTSDTKQPAENEQNEGNDIINPKIPTNTSKIPLPGRGIMASNKSLDPVGAVESNQTREKQVMKSQHTAKGLDEQVVVNGIHASTRGPGRKMTPVPEAVKSLLSGEYNHGPNKTKNDQLGEGKVTTTKPVANTSQVQVSDMKSEKGRIITTNATEGTDQASASDAHEITGKQLLGSPGEHETSTTSTPTLQNTTTYVRVATSVADEGSTVIVVQEQNKQQMSTTTSASSPALSTEKDNSSSSGRRLQPTEDTTFSSEQRQTWPETSTNARPSLPTGKEATTEATKRSKVKINRTPMAWESKGATKEPAVSSKSKGMKESDRRVIPAPETVKSVLSEKDFKHNNDSNKMKNWQSSTTAAANQVREEKQTTSTTVVASKLEKEDTITSWMKIKSTPQSGESKVTTTEPAADTSQVQFSDMGSEKGRIITTDPTKGTDQAAISNAHYTTGKQQLGSLGEHKTTTTSTPSLQNTTTDVWVATSQADQGSTVIVVQEQNKQQISTTTSASSPALSTERDDSSSSGRRLQPTEDATVSSEQRQTWPQTSTTAHPPSMSNGKEDSTEATQTSQVSINRTLQSGESYVATKEPAVNGLNSSKSEPERKLTPALVAVKSVSSEQENRSYGPNKTLSTFDDTPGENTDVKSREHSRPVQSDGRSPIFTSTQAIEREDIRGAVFPQQTPTTTSTSAAVTADESQPAGVNSKRIPPLGGEKPGSFLKGNFQRNDNNAEQRLVEDATSETPKNGIDVEGSNTGATPRTEKTKSQNAQSIESIDRASLERKIISKEGIEDTEDSDESMAFNFTIGALAAVLVFGGLVMSVYGIRHCQRQGTYIISGREERGAHETELHSMDSSRDQSPNVEYRVYKDQSNTNTRLGMK